MQEYFKGIPKIKFEGKDSDNPLAFKFYNPEEIVGNKTMKEHLRFSVAYWHTYMGTGTDLFGLGTMQRDWNAITDQMELAKTKMRASFEFNEKLGIPFFCFHDRDIAPEGHTLSSKPTRTWMKLLKLPGS